jgi:acyl-CoA thioester hydrolase
MEARILMTARLWRDVPDELGRFAMVVAQTDVDYHVPVLFRPEPYDAWSWISHVGQRSFVIESEICDGDVVLSRARVAMVFFDKETQGAVSPPDFYRVPLVAALG